MKTYNIKIEAFKFDELSEDAQAKAINEHIEFLLEVIPYEEGTKNFKKAIDKATEMRTPWFTASYVYDYCKKQILEDLSVSEFKANGKIFISNQENITEDIKKEFKVFVLNCEGDFDFRTAEYALDFQGIMTEANKRDSVYSLEYFQDEINDEELNLSNSFILIREV